MAVPPLALKILGVGAVATPIIGVGVVYGDDIVVSTGLKNQNFSGFENELLKILEDKNKDIVFEVKNGTEDLKASDLGFSAEKKKIVVTAKIDIKDNNENFKSAKDSINFLKKLNVRFGSGKDWTWECKITLDKDSNSSNDLNDNDKNKLIKSSESNDGFFDILKKDLTQTENSKEEWKDLKIRFFKNCISEKQKSTTKDKLTREVLFNLKAGESNKPANLTSTNQIAGKLYFKDTEQFNKWFATPLKLTKWDLHLIELVDKEKVQFSITGDDSLSSFNAVGESGKKEVSVTVAANKSLPSLNKEDSGAAKPWTWKCIIKFVKKDGNNNSSLKQSTELNSFFGKLKDTDKDEKELKIKFIKDCATFNANTPSALSSDTFSLEKTFNLVNSTEANSNNLTFENEEEFKYWFGI